MVGDILVGGGVEAAGDEDIVVERGVAEGDKILGTGDVVGGGGDAGVEFKGVRERGSMADVDVVRGGDGEEGDEAAGGDDVEPDLVVDVPMLLARRMDSMVACLSGAPLSLSS